MPSKIQRRKGKKRVSWRVRFPIEDEDGKQVFHTRTFAYKRDAEEYLQTLEDARKTGNAVVESASVPGLKKLGSLEVGRRLHLVVKTTWSLAPR